MRASTGLFGVESRFASTSEDSADVAWSPLDLLGMRAGLGYYYDFGIPASVTLATGIGAVQDLSAGNRSGFQNTAAAQPAYVTTGGPGGFPFARFDATDDAIVVGNSLDLYRNRDGYTFFCVARPRGTGALRQLTTNLTAAGAARLSVNYQTTNAVTGTTRRLDADTAASSTADPSSNLVTTEWHVIAVVVNFATQRMSVYVNGVVAAVIATTTGPGNSSDTNASALGLLGAGGGNACNTDIAIAGGLGRALTRLEIEQLTFWAGARYGILQASWQLETLGGIHAYYNFAAPGSLVLVGEAVQSIAPIVGAGPTLSAPTAAARPRYTSIDQINGRRAAFFDGVDDVLRSVAGTLAQPFTMVTVAQMTPLTATSARILAEGTGTAAAQGGAAVGGLYTWRTASTLSQTSLTIGAGGQIVQGLFNAASSRGYMDGASVAAGTVGTGSLGGVGLGATGSGAPFLTGLIGAALIFNRALTLTERANLTLQLAREWGITLL